MHQATSFLKIDQTPSALNYITNIQEALRYVLSDRYFVDLLVSLTVLHREGDLINELIFDTYRNELEDFIKQKIAIFCPEIENDKEEIKTIAENAINAIFTVCQKHIWSIMLIDCLTSTVIQSIQNNSDRYHIDIIFSWLFAITQTKKRNRKVKDFLRCAHNFVEIFPYCDIKYCLSKLPHRSNVLHPVLRKIKDNHLFIQEYITPKCWINKKSSGKKMLARTRANNLIKITPLLLIFNLLYRHDDISFVSHLTLFLIMLILNRSEYLAIATIPAKLFKYTEPNIINDTYASLINTVRKKIKYKIIPIILLELEGLMIPTQETTPPTNTAFQTNSSASSMTTLPFTSGVEQFSTAYQATDTILVSSSGSRFKKRKYTTPPQEPTKPDVEKVQSIGSKLVTLKDDKFIVQLQQHNQAKLEILYDAKSLIDQMRKLLLPKPEKIIMELHDFFYQNPKLISSSQNGQKGIKKIKAATYEHLRIKPFVGKGPLANLRFIAVPINSVDIQAPTYVIRYIQSNHKRIHKVTNEMASSLSYPYIQTEL